METNGTVISRNKNLLSNSLGCFESKKLLSNWQKRARFSKLKDHPVEKTRLKVSNNSPELETSCEQFEWFVVRTSSLGTLLS